MGQIHKRFTNEQVRFLFGAYVQGHIKRDIDRVSVKEGATIVTLVGEGMLSRPGIAGAIFTATGQAGINVIAIAQGSSDCGISLVVDGSHGDEAVRAIHAAALERSAPVKSEVPLEVDVDEG